MSRLTQLHLLHWRPPRLLAYQLAKLLPCCALRCTPLKEGPDLSLRGGLSVAASCCQ